MTSKNRGIRLKTDLNRDDRGHQTLLEVTRLQSALLGHTTAAEVLDDVERAVAPRTQRERDDAQIIRRARRRAVARILREGLEDTLALLDEALESCARSDPAGDGGRPPRPGR